MKSNYNKTLKLRCVVCGSDSDFEHNEDNSYVKCTRCNKEYLGGYDELVELNQEYIAAELEGIKAEVAKDLEKDLNKSLRKVLRK